MSDPESPPASERDLVGRARAGDGDAFAALVSSHRTMLFTVCYRVLGQRQDAEDATQLALLAAWRNLDRFEHRSSFSTWLYRIAHNAALGVARRRVPQPVGDISELAGSRASAPEAIAEVDAVRWALARIPPDFRSALVLREYAGMSYREIAAAQGIRVETVKTRIARARKALAVLLEFEGGKTA